MKKNIIFISPKLYPHFVGGIEIFNYYLIQELGKEYQVSYVTTAPFSKKSKIKNAKGIILQNTIKIFQLFELIFYLFKCKGSYDLILTSFSRTSWYYIIIYPILNFLISKEYIIVIHGGGLMRWKWKYPYRFYFKRAKAIVGVSDIICNEYKNRTGINIIQLPPLIPFKKTLDLKDEIRTKYKIDITKKVFLYVGSLKKLKRPEIIVKAFNDLGKNYLIKQKLQMLFVGEGPMKGELIKYCQKMKLTDFIHFKGNVPREHINELYKLSDFYIISSDFEGTPISLLEAMYNKLPIIASDVRGINSVINGNRGVLFNNNDQLSLVSAIKKLVNDEEFAKLISKNSYTYYNDNFDYNNLIENYKRLI